MLAKQQQQQQQQNRSQDHLMTTTSGGGGTSSKMPKIDQTPTAPPNIIGVSNVGGDGESNGGDNRPQEYFLSDSITFPQVSHKLENIADESVIEMAPNDESDNILSWNKKKTQMNEAYIFNKQNNTKN